MSDNLDFLDQTVEQLVDLPVFKPFPNGTYKFTFGYEPLENDDGVVTGIKAEFLMTEIIELANPDQASDVEPGKKLTVILNTVKNDGDKNEFAEGTIKMVASVLRERFQGNSIREILDAGCGAELAATVKLRKYKDKQTGEQREQNQIQELAWAD